MHGFELFGFIAVCIFFLAIPAAAAVLGMIDTGAIAAPRSRKVRIEDWRARRARIANGSR